MPAVPEPLVGALRSAPTARCTPRAATARASTASTTGSSATPLNPCGDPPTGVGRQPRSPPPRAGRCAPGVLQPRRPGRPERHASSASTPTRARRCPATPARRARDPNVRRIVATACATRSASPSGPGTDEVWVGDVGWNTWRRSTGSPTPTDATVDNFGWPCYEGPDHAARLRRRRPVALPEPLRGRHGGPRRYFSYSHADHVVPGESCPWAARRSPASRSTSTAAAPTRRPTTARSSSPTTRATASGSCSAADGRCRARRT